MLTFNKQLFLALPVILGREKSTIESITNVPHSTLYTWEKNLDMPVERLVSFSNALRISMRHFIIDSSEPVILGSEEDYVCRSTKWSNQAFCPSELGRALTKDGTLTVAEAVERAGTTSYMYFKYFGGRATGVRFMLSDFLRICDHAQLDPFRFIVNTSPVTSSDSVPSNQSSAEGSTSITLDTLMQQIHALNRRLTRLEHQNAQLTRELRILKGDSAETHAPSMSLVAESEPSYNATELPEMA